LIPIHVAQDLAAGTATLLTRPKLPFQRQLPGLAGFDPDGARQKRPLSGRPVEAPLLIALVISGFSRRSFRNHSKELE
jgi:hypothetical protein